LFIQRALESIVQDLGNVFMAEEIRSLWLEYEEGTSLEAELARQLDKFEMIVQANEYELANPGKRLDRFFESTKDCFSHPEV
jgi:putative hydrolase of HD superfamily